MTVSTPEIQFAIGYAESTMNPEAGRGHRVEIYQHELAVLVAAANECVRSRIAEEEARYLRHGND